MIIVAESLHPLLSVINNEYVPDAKFDKSSVVSPLLQIKL